MHSRPPSRRLRRALCAAACALAAVSLAAPAAQAFSWVSYPELLAQVRSGPVIRVIVNHRGGGVEIKFKDLYEWKARTTPAQETEVVALVHSRHIHLIFAGRPHAKPKPAAVHHHLRYIAAGVLAVAVIAGGAVLLFRRRARHRREADGPSFQRAAG